MTALPPSVDFTAAASESAYKSTVSAQRAYLAGLLGADGTVATALAALGALGSGYAAKTATYTITPSDRGKLIEASNTWTLSLPTAASAGLGFSFALRNSGAGVITVDPDSAETIDGAATLDFDPGAGTIIVSTGTAWVTAGPKVQSGAYDSTAGRLMSVGAFGIGLTGTADEIPDVDAHDTASGVWRFTASTVNKNSLPADLIGESGGIKVDRLQASFSVQTVWNRDGSGTIWTRHSASSVWTSWSAISFEGQDIGATTPAAGTFTDVALSGALNLNGNVTGGEQQTIDDDAVGTFTPPPGFKGGFVRVTCRGDHDAPRAQASADLWCDVGVTLAAYKNSGWTTVGSEVDESTSDVTGTTGTDGRVTIATQTGDLKIENRLGGSRTFRVKWG